MLSSLIIDWFLW